MHTEPRTTRRSVHRLAIAGAGLLGVAGLGIVAIGGATGAMASTPGTVNGAPSATVTVTASVPQVTTLTLDSTAINFPTPASLPGTVNASLTGTATTNDASGYTVSVTPVDVPGLSNPQIAAGTHEDDLLGNVSTGDHIPLSDLSVNNTAFTSMNSAAPAVTADTTSTAATNPISDNYALAIPGAQAADSYTAQLTYTIVGQ